MDYPSPRKDLRQAE